MMVLARKLGEEIVIETEHGPVRVTVTSIDRGRVKLGFTCDRSIPIMRDELLEDDTSEGDEL